MVKKGHWLMVVKSISIPSIILNKFFLKHYFQINIKGGRF
jgi:hypothetical protein